jgi:hypothetical protein
MKSKLVLWGNNAQDEKVLIAVALRPEENKVDIWTFPEAETNEDFYQKMMREWRDGEGLEFPENHTHQVRELTLSESLLPDDLKAERTDVIHRAQTEWHFLVLSSKLHQSYEDQLVELRERVSQLENFDQGTWDSLREFWDKVQEQVRERNLFRDHADKLKDNINSLFSNLKDLRQKADDEFDRISGESRDWFFQALDEIEQKMEGGGRLANLFDELKKLQRKFREVNLTRDHRSKVWEKLDTTFKNVKQKRFGNRPADDGGGNSAYQRLKRRYDGLIGAIEKMEQSIKRDKNDLDFQHHKIDTTSGQLEAQIRQAKIIMIEERIHSKDEKMAEMNATKIDLEKRLASLKDKETRRVAQEAMKEKIAEGIKAAAEAREDVADKLEKAAEEIAVAKPARDGKKAAKSESIVDAVGVTLGESLEDVVDTVKAAAQVIGDKIEDAIKDIIEDDDNEVKENEQEESSAPEVSVAETPASEEEPATTETVTAEEAEPAAEEAGKD